MGIHYRTARHHHGWLRRGLAGLYRCPTHTHTHKGNAMLTIDNATVQTLDQTQARPTGKTVLSVTIGDHTFDMLIDEDELIQALASQHA